MSQGIDIARRLDPISIGELATRYPGMKFVIRYVGDWSNPKNMSTEEYGLIVRLTKWYVVAVYETNPTSARYFADPNRGREDAVTAARHARMCGHLAGAIYCTIDYDAPEEDDGMIEAYIRAWASNIPDDYIPGVYGSGAVCAVARRVDPKIKIWRSLSSGWRGYDIDQKYDLIQRWCDDDYDLDYSDGDAGGWRPPGK